MTVPATDQLEDLDLTAAANAVWAAMLAYSALQGQRDDDPQEQAALEIATVCAAHRMNGMVDVLMALTGLDSQDASAYVGRLVSNPGAAPVKAVVIPF